MLTAHCNKCDVELSLDNWHRTNRERNVRVCKTCQREQALEACKKSNPNRMYVNGKYIPKSHPLFKPGRYKTFSDAAFDGTYKLDTIKEGYVYVITNKAWPDWVKIGMAIDAEDRCNGYQTSSPFRDYVLEHTVETNDRRKSEREAHTKAAKLAKETSGEWFKLDVETAKQILDNLNEHGRRATEETNTVTQEDKLQELPAQADLWSYAENRKAS
jgi:hypothetical protein